MIQIISWIWVFSGVLLILLVLLHSPKGCLLYTSDAADDMQCVDLGGRRIIKNGPFFIQLL